MKDMVLLGDEAFALGLLHAGLSAGFGYPGTPSTEIMEFLIDNYEKNREKDANTAIAQWCSNEKTALEAALGVSFAGKRSVVTMKHVGLNVAADPFMNASLCQIKGGLIIAVADDPSMHSSQGEQDTRFYSDFAMVPCFEPTSQQEAYEMAFEAFEVSEKYNVPVIFRFTTRLSHSRAVVKPVEKALPQLPLQKGEPVDWKLLPAFARKNYKKMIEKQDALCKYSENSKRNELVINEKRTDLAIITGGLGKNYYEENLIDYKNFCEKNFPGLGLPSTLHIGVYPLPEALLEKISNIAQTILVIEEGQPFIEKQLRSALQMKTKVIGKFTGVLPRDGELTPDLVRNALGMEANANALNLNEELKEFCSNLANRPPQFCAGCPHIDSYTSLNMAVEELSKLAGKNNVCVNADIGCYALGGAAPMNAAETIVCMGASVGMARGAATAGVKYAFGVIGDSTFVHSGITNLVDCVATKTPVTILLLDNSIVAMTGCQPTMIPSSQFEPLIKGLGVESEHIRVLETAPKNREENAKIIQEEAEYRGVSVIIMVRECLEAFRIRNKKAKK